MDRTNPFGNGHVLPRGILREPVGNIRRADFIFITKSRRRRRPRSCKARLRDAESARRKSSSAGTAPRYLQNVFTGERRPLEFLDGLTVVAVSGIAAPDGFEDELERQGARDPVTRSASRTTTATASRRSSTSSTAASEPRAEAIITTEKDAVRFPQLERCDVPVYFLRVEIEMLSGEEDFHAVHRAASAFALQAAQADGERPCRATS